MQISVTPNGSQVRVWIPDGSVAYFSGKHVPPILVVSLIILTGILYTILLFSWQWLVQISDWKNFKWTRNVTLGSMVSSIHSMPHMSANVVTGLDCC